MKKLHRSWVAVAAAALLVACSGGGEGDQSPRVSYGKLVTFGDSLSDVGTYGVGIVASFGGGKYTINGNELSLNWTELLAKTIDVADLCPAQTGLNSAVELGGPIPTQNFDSCYSYAQGGARVTDPVGPGNIALWTVFGDPSGMLGQLTDPVVNQITRHLAKPSVGNAFAADDLVTVMAGGNDLFMNLAAFESLVGGGMPPAQATTTVVGLMQTAGTQLATLVKDQILAHGAQRVVVVNVPSAQNAPAFLGSPDTQALVTLMVTGFNSALATGLAGTEANVLQVDAYTVSADQALNPAQYGLSNVTTPACDLEGALADLPTSLVCSELTLIGGDVTYYQYADTVHPTPYGYKLLAQLVTQEMAKKGWL
jgi:outer membrane lipase/esterase